MQLDDFVLKLVDIRERLFESLFRVLLTLFLTFFAVIKLVQTLSDLKVILVYRANLILHDFNQSRAARFGFQVLFGFGFFYDFCERVMLKLELAMHVPRAECPGYVWTVAESCSSSFSKK